MLGLTAEGVTAAASAVAALAAVGAALIAIRNTRRSVEALEMPFLIPQPRVRGWLIRWSRHPSEPDSLLVKMWNVGKGPAIMGDVRLTVNGVDLIAPAGGEIPLGPDDKAKVGLQLLSDAPSDEGRGRLRIYYTHASGAEYMTLCEAIAREGGSFVRTTAGARATVRTAPTLTDRGPKAIQA